MFSDTVLQTQNLLLLRFAAAGLLATVTMIVFENIARGEIDEKISEMNVDSHAFTVCFTILVMTFYVKRASCDVIEKAICVQELCSFLLFLSVPYRSFFKPLHTALLIIAFGYNLTWHAYHLAHRENNFTHKNWFSTHIALIFILGAVQIANISNHYYIFQLLVLTSYVTGTLL